MREFSATEGRMATHGSYRERVYQALTQAKHFAQIVEMGIPGAGASTVISLHPGGEFSLFGDRIIGRHLEI